MIFRNCVLICLFLAYHLSVFSQKILLNQHWQFKSTTEKKWHDATVPGTVHTDLLANHIIDDPFYRDNETKQQWISKQDWEYKTSFGAEKQSTKAVLQFEGLDTYAKVYLNDSLILQSDNMFRTYRIEVGQLLKQQNNQLRIVFESAENKAAQLAKNSPRKFPCENQRNFVRKAQYHFGWDWAHV
ncbi:MAG: hypothetical protein IPF62_05320 [Bacteroidetes bacterium]|nr:hypothetical protein [Bacteroidota bacterium]